jgi:hypothetical protein
MTRFAHKGTTHDSEKQIKPYAYVMSSPTCSHSEPMHVCNYNLANKANR